MLPPSWKNRDSPDYDPNLIGAISQAKVVAALIEAGKQVLLPAIAGGPYDLVIEERERFFRVQCKTGRLFRGAIWFRTCHFRARARETAWKRRVKTYEGAVDFFGVYCPDNGSVYFVPIEDVGSQTACWLRVDPPKNNQNKRIRWAREYLVAPLHPARQPLTKETLLFD